MLRTLASLVFYATFYRRFARSGMERRAAHWQPYPIALDGQRWLVTGASGGIGAAIVRLALSRGAEVIAAARRPEALERLRQALGAPARLQIRVVDFSSIRQTRALAGRLAAAAKPIDVLVNNVGVLATRFERTDEGLEASFVTNLLSHFVLTEGLHAGGVLAASGAVINVSSGGMYGAALDLAALNRTEPAEFDGMAAYAQHKRAQVELTRAWNRRWSGAPRCYVMHPGWADTAGVRTALPGFRRVLASRLRSPEHAADTVLWLGTTRPPLAAEGGIWLDRVLDPEHAFAYTRQSRVDDVALRAFLAEHADRIDDGP